MALNVVESALRDLHPRPMLDLPGNKCRLGWQLLCKTGRLSRQANHLSFYAAPLDRDRGDKYV
jgi:hypothetical protein